MDSTDAGQVEEYLWFGSIVAAESEEFMQKRKIGYVLTVGNDIDPVYIETINYKMIKIDDSPHVNLFPHLVECIEFITTGVKSKSTVFVHCAAGISRSCSMVCAYLMASRNISYEAALEIAKNDRPFARPNKGFSSQLQIFEKLGYQVPVTETEIENIWQTGTSDVKKVLTDYCIIQNNEHLKGILRDLVHLDRKNVDLFQPGDIPDTIQAVSIYGNLLEKEEVRKSYQCQCGFELFRRCELIDHNIYPLNPLAYLLNMGKAKECSVHMTIYKSWMGQVGMFDGNIYCPGCAIELGFYNWEGEACRCSSFIDISFFIYTEKAKIVEN